MLYRLFFYVDVCAGELNAHIPEQFNGVYQAAETPDKSAPASAPARVDIYDYFNILEAPVAGGTWLQKPEFPSPSEILPDPHASTTIVDVSSEDIKPNKVEGSYADHEEYLSTQYDFLREDSIRPLRDAVVQVRKDPWLDEAQYPHNTSIGIYEPVYITAMVFSPRGLATRVAFSLSRVKKLVRWSQSKRLVTGTLVALSPADDCFQTQCILATVAARPLSALEQNPPEIDLFFARPDEIHLDPMKKWIMVESRSSFFEASRHTLMALQHLKREPFPLSEHLVDVQPQVDPPEYILENPFTDISSLVALEESKSFENVDILHNWPGGSSHGLDKSQSAALKRILSKRLAIVQGPPGTGKTYVSVVALKILLANMKKGDPPIVVTCQTNHALDQILRHVAEFEPSFIRLGGRSKDQDKIKARTLYNVRSNMSQPRSLGSRKAQAMCAIRELTKKMQMLLLPLEVNKPPLTHKLLTELGLITEEQARSLEDESQEAMGVTADTPGIEMEQWLGRNLVPCHRSIGPDDFGFEFEEEDFELEQLKELEAEVVAQDDDDIEALKGPHTLLCDNFTGRGAFMTDHEVKQLITKTQDLTCIPSSHRGAIYNYFQRESKRILRADFRKFARKYEDAVLDRRIGQWEEDHRILKDQRVIGMTTTGLSKYRALISSLKPRIVLVEEAAETLEPPVTAACVPSLQHLILVGDHQQLRPHLSVREFEKEPYRFNLSLFERMVNNGVEFDALRRQRRMKPEIRRLLGSIYGKELQDHPSVTDLSNRPPVEGMGGIDSFFFTHEWLESHDANMSAINIMEADMIVGFVNYLIWNGIEPAKITILTFYNGQRKAILKQIRNHAELRMHEYFNVVTVDSYQGEENDIVLLSLVRSNDRYKIGFLSVVNRVCVALSRAKRGFYIFGNGEMLAAESETWAYVVEALCGKKRKKDIPTTGPKLRIGYRLPLECINHQRKTFIKGPSAPDVLKNPNEVSAYWDQNNGGCDLKCSDILPCGHTCMLGCHPFEHDRINCTQKCLKTLDCQHQCSAICMDPCKCDRCDRRGNNGERSLLKPPPRNAAYNPAARTVPPSPQYQAPHYYGNAAPGATSIGGRGKVNLTITELQSLVQADKKSGTSGSSIE
ncbi:P-loop containing nucleoside triphosphate hydrolase protein [Clohesyomyces aquaticus]|uniref:p-loop containing nucleoside triphosphate hydrolase protein n=1 Tax=Clohesyomyces aquaticus TaxID=1231657 RepID=A0A1Y1ZRQ5_9PLEO|nr:P-loop containing nucleoside triphosphate hydrolase protein [Clohesyomyces aquaticus]